MSTLARGMGTRGNILLGAGQTLLLANCMDFLQTWVLWLFQTLQCMVTDVAITLVLGRLMQVDDDNGEMIHDDNYEIDCHVKYLFKK